MAEYLLVVGVMVVCVMLGIFKATFTIRQRPPGTRNTFLISLSDFGRKNGKGGGLCVVVHP